ncbi:MAG: hydrogenase maturation nickel metallochaperone HypA [Pseudomonadales bacterium]|nr:hydrogenase maturation nickel metallochaperone HypA [Pseudomonadales bacterium]
MHEMGITQSVIAIVIENANSKKVIRVLLEIGKLSAIMPDAIRFCFDICAKGTVLDGAKLEILEIEGRAECNDCGSQMVLTQLAGHCRCGSRNLTCIAGEELNVKEMEIA